MKRNLVVGLILGAVIVIAVMVMWRPGQKSEIYGDFSDWDPQTTDLYFRKGHKNVDEHSLRKGDTTAHIYLDSTDLPYLFFAFPAGNSGVGLWFKGVRKGSTSIRAVEKPYVETRRGGLRGAVAEVEVSTRNLQLSDAVLGSMRFIRERELGHFVAPEVLNHTIKVVDQTVVMHRKSLNGLAEYVLEMEPVGETELVQSPEGLRLRSSKNVRFRVRGFSSEPPITPMSPEKIFRAEVLPDLDPHQLQMFSFLLSQEKLMAGSPRYFSKFGRDSLYTLYVMMDLFTPEAIEYLLVATLSSADPETGNISHEQNEGDFASLERMKKGQSYLGIDQPIEDYEMIDDDFAFTIALGGYIKRYPERVADFLSRKDLRGQSVRDLVEKNLNYVAQVILPFASDPKAKNLLRLMPGKTAGQWRDSIAGLGGGVYPFDVNAAFVPGAIQAVIAAQSLPKVGLKTSLSTSQLQEAFQVWSTQVVPLFRIHYSAREFAALSKSYLTRLSMWGALSLPASLTKRPVEILGISLAESGKPIPIMHSDDSLMMIFGFPSAEYLDKMVERILSPFPYGLNTGAGILVANPVAGSQKLQDLMTEHHYHGRVSWTMQEDLLILGIDRQLMRPDLSETLRQKLSDVQRSVKSIMERRSHLTGVELLSIVFRDKSFQAVPFAGDAKSNSNQLWSYLRMAESSSTQRTVSK